MLVATITSIAVLAIFQVARYETLETVARSRASQARWIALSAKEVAVARLLTDPSFRGEFKLELTPGSGQWASVQVQGDDQQLMITASGNVKEMHHTVSSSFTWQQFKERLAMVSQNAPVQSAPIDNQSPATMAAASQ